MLILKNITKDYETGGTLVRALDDVTVAFRKNEFVSILGHSGCGKTTLLNIIGGLDRYTDGDISIKGVSTKNYKDADWDTYRNHSIGFVFQSYNLIPHQTVLSNVELALTLSGVSKAERRKRAEEVLVKVGLGDQLHKKPSQMSGGQMQRVAIARALVNDPEILLADEPTGALDTDTSVQIMNILREISKDKLIIMVTHNPELADEYSDRIIRLKDGRIVGDSNPYLLDNAQKEIEALLKEEEESEKLLNSTDAVSDEIGVKDTTASPKSIETNEASNVAKKKKIKKKKRPSMSFFTAISLSFNNLLTKKTRTFMTSFAGSIGIIGIALILALSNGVSMFIESVQEDTLTSYPISITAQNSDYSAMLAAMVGTSDEEIANRDPNKIYVDDSISEMVSAMVTMESNNLSGFNEYFESRKDEFKDDILAVQYSYNMDLQIYNANSNYGDKGLIQANPSNVLSNFSSEYSGLSMITDSISIFSEMMPGRNGELINDSIYSQYDVVDGRWPEAANEIVVVVGKNNTISNITLYMLGVLNPDDMAAMMASMMMGQQYEAKTNGMEFSYQDFYDLELFVAYNSDFYEKTGKTYDINGVSLPIWADKRDSDNFEAGTLRGAGMELKVVGFITPNEDATSTSIGGSVAYTSALTDAVLEKINESEIVKQQINHPTHDVFNGLRFKIEDADTLSDTEKADKLDAYFNSLTTGEKVDAFLKIRTEVTDDEMKGYLAKIKEIINTREKQRQFLIDLYGFNSKNGSLDMNSTANEAVAAILLATDMLSDEQLLQLGVVDVNNKEQVLNAYKTLVPSFSDMFGLDGIPLKTVNEDPNIPVNSKAYQTFNGLISTMYNTDEKLERAFDSMTEMTFKSVYSMVEAQNVQNEIRLPSAPHYQTFVSGTDLTNPAKRGELVSFVTAKLFEKNGITNPASSLGTALMQYVGAMTDTELLSQYYNIRLDTDEGFKNEAIAALFDAYRTDAKQNSLMEFAALYANHMNKSDGTYDGNLVSIGSSLSPDSLKVINIYPVNFEAKERLVGIINDYNAQEDLSEDDRIKYTDIMAIMMSSVTVIIDAITYVLIAFVSISLVVSSIMIGIITYISVLERTKEIGILRAIGASKKDVSRVFNAETLIIGFTAGAIGIIFTLLLCLPINAIIHAVSGMNNINASLPIVASFILLGISMFLTLIAGLIPAGLAAKKDPVEALRSE